MEIARTLFGPRAPQGYTDGNTQGQVHTAADDDEDADDVFLPDTPEGLSTGIRATGGSNSTEPSVGGPFSAITPSMWPQDILTRLSQQVTHQDPNHQPDYRFDEFGFRVEEEDGPEQNSTKLLSQPFVEDPQHRLHWIAYLEFSHSDEVGELTWEHVDTRLPRTDKLRGMVRGGLPHSLRPQLWMRLSGALQKQRQSDISYREVVKASSNDALMTSKQIEKDLLRTMPTNACFSQLTSTGIPRLRRVLRALAWLYPDIGYCQGTGMVVASLLLFLEEEDAFWVMCTIVEDLLPASYYSSTLLGVQADQRVLAALVCTYLPGVDSVVREHDIELSLITLHWFVTVFASVLHMKILLRVWDMFFLDGSIVLFQVTLAMLKIKEAELRSLENSAQIFNALSDIPGEIDDVTCLFKVMESVCGSLTDVMVETHRRRHLAYLMADHGALINPDHSTNLPKQQLNRRQVNKSKSVLEVLLFKGDQNADDIRNKNIRQTELLVDLREAILQVGRHFQGVEPNYTSTTLTPDYSIESHSRDIPTFLATARSRHRRAKALLDFERHDDDELGFRKNDIITIISQRDEHCWIGELNGLRGWFPAKFVEVLDERSKEYSRAGDDAISATVTDLVRGTLCPAVKAILQHGMRSTSLLGGPCHPWLFIEESAAREVERDFSSVYSRLVLCRTFRLDEDGKVLTPEELLYRCVQAVNMSHDAVHAQMDVKLRSLICLGLNEQVLHLWLEVLCSSVEVVERWYLPSSFLRSPGWVQIKCELRVLAQFPFTLNPDWELPPPPNQDQRPLREGVRDMLVKHHLFSWDL
ncbi:small G protein signaling modulator 3 homolog isoform X2 [Portunus trituberculatus]|nr:small G protein signaling modulator 3 homolog isoform X2 [Portunus trituberculatus]XP_045135377.1 small G protein signaling modulator 3 homolog isoform X2 [Portunus trituberculatus]XP_045135379.1 small G protein signaling modulator 3 homolog isoform X2 [Portunus trituberculatus]